MMDDCQAKIAALEAKNAEMSAELAEAKAKNAALEEAKNAEMAAELAETKAKIGDKRNSNSERHQAFLEAKRKTVPCKHFERGDCCARRERTFK